MKAKLGSFFLIVLLGISTACGEAENLEADLVRDIVRAQEESLSYIYLEEADGRTVEVKGKIEDSIRHSEVLLVDGQGIMERVVHDDALALNVKFPDQVAALSAPEPADLAVAEALRRGEWVIDPSGAPPEGSAGQTTENVGADALDDAANVFQYVQLAIGQAAGVIRFSADRIDYLPEEDPFPHPNEDLEEERFDLIPPPLPRRQGEISPGPAAFRRMSIYLVEGRVVRILEQIDIDTHPEIKRARETGRNRFLIGLAEEVKAGRTDQKIRERSMSFEIMDSGEPVTVTIPTEGFVGNLRVLFGERQTDQTQGEPTSPPVVPAPGAPPPAAPPQPQQTP